MLQTLPGAGHTFLATGSGKSDAASAAVTQKLVLKPGAQVVLLKNLDPERGLMNGSRGVVVAVQASVKHTGKQAPLVKFHNGVQRLIERERWEIKVGDKTVGSQKQIPLALAWALTIHKSQGMTLDCAQIALAECFEYGQAYVALSRVRSLEGLELVSLDRSKIRAHPRVVEFYRKLTPAAAPPSGTGAAPSRKRTHADAFLDEPDEDNEIAVLEQLESME